MNLTPALHKQFDDFVTYLKVNGYDDSYSKKIPEFLAFCQFYPVATHEVTYEHLSKYMLQLKERKGREGNGISQGHLNNHIKALKCFFRFLIASQDIGHSALEQISKFKQKTPESKIRIFITLEEFFLALSKVLNDLRLNPYKVQVILYFMFFTGVRKKELCNLKRADIDIDNLKATIKIPRKNKKEYRVFFPIEVADLLRKYYRIEEEKDNAFNINKRQVDYIISLMDKYLPKDKHVTPHSMRHSYAMMLVENDVDVRKAMDLLGHTSLNSTLVYYNPTEKQLEKTYHQKIKGTLARR